MDHVYDWSTKSSTNNLNLEIKEEKIEKKIKEVKTVSVKKDEKKELEVTQKKVTKPSIDKEKLDELREEYLVSLYSKNEEKILEVDRYQKMISHL